MKHPDTRLFTPLYVKTDRDTPMPDDEAVYYVLSSSGLYLCRNNTFFESCVKARHWPAELVPHDEVLRLSYPRMRRSQLELIVGFFAAVFEQHGAEAAAILLWDREAGRLRICVPPQTATVRRGYSGEHHPLDVRYDLPENLNPKFSPIGTIHSHGDCAAYASHTDQRDEDYRAGLHIVVGRIAGELPQFHCEFVVDGVRFRTDLDAVTEGYGKRSSRFPRDWLQRVQIEVEKPKPVYHGNWHNGTTYGGH